MSDFRKALMGSEEALQELNTLVTEEAARRAKLANDGGVMEQIEFLNTIGLSDCEIADLLDLDY